MKPAQKPVTVTIVDSQSLFVESLSLLLSSDRRFKIDSTFTSPRAALAHIEKSKPDIVLTELVFNNGSGFEMARQLSTLLPETAVVALDSMANDLRIFSAVKNHLKGYFLKSDSSDFLKEGLIRIATIGLFCAPDNILGRIPILVSRNDGFCGLSARESQVLIDISQGYPTREIAQRLNLSIKTIDSYREHIKTKLGIRTVHEMMIAAGDIRAMEQDRMAV